MKAPQKTANGTPNTPTSKSGFILSLPTDMPAKQVVEKGKAAGLKFPEKYVYTARALAKARALKKAARATSVGLVPPPRGDVVDPDAAMIVKLILEYGVEGTIDRVRSWGARLRGS